MVIGNNINYLNKFMTLKNFDLELIHFFRRVSIPVARFALFVVFFWFGLLKVVGLSPASGLVQRLFESSISFMSFGIFLICFGIFECLIGILFLIKGAERVVIPLLLVHMITTFGPLVLLPSETWQQFMVPTLEGQYIIKNLVIIAAGIGIAAHLHPFKKNPV
jgi:uncharacterized membrane protein YkgB